MSKTKLDFSNPGHIKLSILAKGINIKDPSVFSKVKFAPNIYQFGLNNSIDGKIPLPSELVIKEDVHIGINHIPTSPWSVIYKDKKLWLTYEDKTITDIFLVQEPEFYKEKLKNNKSITTVVRLYGKYLLAYFIRGWCHYFKVNKACKFCSLGYARKSLGKENEIILTPEVAKEASELIAKHPDELKKLEYVNYSAGSLPDNDLGVIQQIKVIKEVTSTLNKVKKLKHHLLTMPPDTLSLIKDIKKAGIDSLAFALEVWGEDRFKYTCPGKHEYYGYDRFFEAFEYGLKVFGKGNMYANLITGIQPLESLLEGIDFFGKMGIPVSSNVFHPDKGTPFENKEKPSEEYIIETVKLLTRIYLDNNFKAIYPKCGTRNSLDAEIAKGFFKDLL